MTRELVGYFLPGNIGLLARDAAPGSGDCRWQRRVSCRTAPLAFSGRLTRRLWLILVLVGVSLGLSRPAAAQTPTFSGPTSYPVFSGPFGIAVANLNPGAGAGQDSHLDLVVASIFGNQIRLLKGDGAGGFTFGFQDPITVGNGPAGVAVGDLNGDGHPDIVVANSGDNTVSVLLGDGVGNFTPGLGSPLTAGTTPYAVAIADFNLDGKPDLAVTNNDSNNVSVFLQNPSGGFTTTPTANYAVGLQPRGIAVGLLNNDTRPDIVVTNNNDPGTTGMSVLLGDVTLGFAAAVNYATGTNPRGIALADLNADGHPDAIVANEGSNTVSVLLGNADGTFQGKTDYVPNGTAQDPTGVAVGDFNLDGKLDVAVANRNLATVTLFNGDGAGALVTPGTDLTTGTTTNPAFIGVGDFKEDGKPDVAVTNFATGDVAVFLNTTAGAATADLSITKTDGLTSATPGQVLTYTIVVTNAGPSTATGATVTDTFPTALTGVTWTCLGTAGGTCTASGSGNISQAVTLPSGGSVTFTATGTINPAATGSLTNTASVAAPGGVTDPNTANNTATDTDTLTPPVTANLSITKTDGKTTAIPGQSDTYTIVVANAGPGAVTNATVADTFPAFLTGVTWTCGLPTGGGSCGTASGSGNINHLVTLPSGASVTFTAIGTINPTATGTLVNTATVTAPGGVTDPVLTNNTATDTDTLTPTADLSITKTDGLTSAIPGQSLTYTITVANAGPSTATGATVADTFPAFLTGVTWTCAGAGGGTCGAASGSGNINQSVTLPSGANVIFTATATINPTATGTLVNTATVTAPGGVTDPIGNNTSTDTDTLTPTADLSITNTDGVTSATPGQAVTYAIVVANAGPSTATGAQVVDTFPASLTGVTWTCLGAAGGTCGAASGSGNISQSVTLPSGGSVTFTATGTINPAATGSLANSAAVNAPGGATDSNPANNTATDTDTLTPTVDLSITNTDGQTTAIPGQSVTYTIVVANTGPSTATGATVADTFPAALTGIAWTCVGAGGGSCGTASGSGSISQSVTVPPSGNVTFTATGTINPTATGTLTNTATVTAPGGVAEPNTANNTATDTDTLVASANLSITKTGPAFGTRGADFSYTIVVTNAGPSSASSVQVVDPTPTGLTFKSITGASCPTGFPCTLGTLAPGDSTITATYNIPVDYDVETPIVNTATVSSATADPDHSNDTATATTKFGAFYTVTPCRLIDTRGAQAPALQAGVARLFDLAALAAASCGASIPHGAQAVSVNVTVTQGTAPGNVRLYPADVSLPTVSTINFTAGQTRANNAIVATSGDGLVEINVFNSSTGTVHFILDVNGYFE